MKLRIYLLIGAIMVESFAFGQTNTPTNTPIPTSTPTSTPTVTPTATATATPYGAAVGASPAYIHALRVGEGYLNTDGGMDVTYLGNVLINRGAPTPNEIIVDIMAAKTPVWRADEDGDTTQTGAASAASFSGSASGLTSIPGGQINADTVDGTQLADIIKNDNDGGLGIVKAAATANEIVGYFGVGATPTPVWKVDEDGDTFQSGSQNWGSGDYISSSAGLLYFYQSSTLTLQLGSALIESKVVHDFENNLTITVADKKITQPADSSGGGPFTLSGMDAFTPQVNLTWYRSGTTMYWYLNGNSGTQSIDIALNIPVEQFGGTVLVDQITIYANTTHNNLYLSATTIRTYDRADGTSDYVADNGTDFGNGNTTAFAATCLAADLNRATYDEGLYLQLTIVDTVGASYQFQLYDIKVQYHLE